MAQVTKFTKKGTKLHNLEILEEGFFKYKEKVLTKCSCGNEKYITFGNIKSGTTKGCGCSTGNNLKTHGLGKNPLYKVWCGIKERCNNKNSKSYHRYGERGIAYDKKWEKFEGFYQDMKEGYNKKLEIDRIDNDGNYCKENCRWITSKENNRNRSNNRVYKGKCIAEWCEELELNYKRVMNRINKHKWNIERALDLSQANK